MFTLELINGRTITDISPDEAGRILKEVSQEKKIINVGTTFFAHHQFTCLIPTIISDNDIDAKLALKNKWRCNAGNVHTIGVDACHCEKRGKPKLPPEIMQRLMTAIKGFPALSKQEGRSAPQLSNPKNND